MQIQLLRHATFVVTIKGLKILVDPMFSPAGAMDPVQNAGNQKRIPLADLPLTGDELRRLLDQLNAVLVTHVHRDHAVWVASLIGKSTQSKYNPPCLGMCNLEPQRSMKA